MTGYRDAQDPVPDGAADQPAGEHGMSRRQLMRHAGWFGGAVVLTVAAGEVTSRIAGPRGTGAEAVAATGGALRFVQVSDSHIGFHGPANTDVAGSFTKAIDQVNALGFRPDFVMHSGDLTHLSTADQFDQVRQMMTRLRTDRVFTVPGEHDSIGDAGRAYRQIFGSGTLGDGWYSFDTHGVHFVALVNTLSLEKLGHLGTEQIDFVRKDLSGLSSDTPIVVFS
ncbi:metallophosphoesterase family protein, partial [Streptomyces broussonetiae]